MAKTVVKHDVRREYAAWLATPRRLRSSLGLPSSKTEFAAMKGVNPRTLNRWEARPDFALLVEQRKVELANGAPNSAVSAVGPPRPVTDPRAAKKFEPAAVAMVSDDPVWDEQLSPDEQRYVQVKDTLVRSAMDGNQSAIDLYMKHYGRPFVEAEQKAGNMFPEMSDEDLMGEVCRLVGVERLSKFLADSAVFA